MDHIRPNFEGVHRLNMDKVKFLKTAQVRWDKVLMTKGYCSSTIFILLKAFLNGTVFHVFYLLFQRKIEIYIFCPIHK